MEVLNILERAVNVTSKIIQFGAGIQNPARERLITKLTRICNNCERAYETMLTRLVPVKDALQDRKKLARELRALAADAKTRKAFKPDRLCGEIDKLLLELDNNLKPLKYALDRRRLDDIRKYLGDIGYYDGLIYEQYNVFTRTLDQIATDLRERSPRVAKERMRYARYLIEDFETDLSSAIEGVRQARSRIVGGRGEDKSAKKKSKRSGKQNRPAQRKTK